MAIFTAEKLSCRVKKLTQLFASVYDTEPLDTIIQAGTRFISEKQCKTPTGAYLHITSGPEKFVGYWCPAAVVQTKVSAEPEPVIPKDLDGEPYQTILTIKGTNATIYKSMTSNQTIPSVFRLGDTIKVDQRIYDTVNGVLVTRYHIAETTSDDQTVIGCWILDDENVLDTVATTKETVTTNRTGTMVRAATPTRTAQNDAVKKPSSNTYTSADAEKKTQTIYIPNDITRSGSGRYFQVEVGAIDATGESVTSNVTINKVYNPSAYFDTFGSGYQSQGYSLQRVPVGRMMFVHGMPFQYTYITDRRLNSNQYMGCAVTDLATFERRLSPTENNSASTYGRSFIQEIIYNLPIAVIMPGTPEFMQPNKPLLGIDIGGKRRKNIVTAFFPMMAGLEENTFENIMDGIGEDAAGNFQYYTLRIETSQYFKYVNSICSASAHFMGIAGATTYYHNKLGSVAWEEYNSNAVQDFNTFETAVGISAGISFAFDPQSSFSSTIQNVTTASQFESTLNGVTASVNELNFIMGITGTGFDWQGKYEQDALAQLESSFSKDSSTFGNVWDRLTTWLPNLTKGMNIRFPEIWQDSSHTPSYEMEMHFITPYATPFCIWRYVLVPFYHIFALSAPRSDVNSGQYSSPFLIRVFSKGYFNVEMGIVDSISWKRFGDGDMISENGIPTQIDVSITFKDLYHSLGLTDTGIAGSNLAIFVNNSGLMDMIGTLSGVNTTKLTMGDRLSMLGNEYESAWSKWTANIADVAKDVLRSALSHLGITGITSSYR